MTFINLWATYCTPCVQELPHFDAFYREHGENVAVLAVHSSVVTDNPKEYLDDKSYNFSFAVDTEDDLVWNIVNGSSTIPQTIVLDRNGVVIYNRKGSVTPSVLEALYEQASGGDTSLSEQEPVVDKTADVYYVFVTDEEGAPVPGVTVQFCSDIECMMGKTDSDGIASFDREAGTYTVHILKVPEGYAADATEYAAPSTPGIVTIVLRAD